jgi:hypothetical protein
LTDVAVVSRFGVPETEFLRRVDPGLEIPWTLQTGLGAERQLPKKIVVSFDYVFTRGAHLWRESNINAPVLPAGFETLTGYLLSRDFDNRPGRDGRRPLTGSNADVVRFTLGESTSSTPGSITVENGLRVVSLGLNAPRSSNVAAALNAVRFLRPDPSLGQVEQLESSGNSFYHGAVFTFRQSVGTRLSFRVSYTLSKVIDEGTTNTASPQDLLDRRSERALSLQDQRHRAALSGTFKTLLGLDLSPVVVIGSSRPFNIGSGVDRNLNDIQNDRPNFIALIERPQWRRPGQPGDSGIRNSLALAPIGSSGNLPRNYGRGPGTRAINLRASRSFSIKEIVRIRAAADVFNLFNNAWFSFGSEFINRDDADLLVARRTQRPRIIQLNLRVSF